MTRFGLRLGSLAAVAFVLGLTGCSGTATPPTPAPSTATTSADQPAGLAKLSDADRAAAIKQDICPVTGEKLGSMGAPPKVTVEGKEIFLCCAGCEEELRKDPAKHLAKLKTP